MKPNLVSMLEKMRYAANLDPLILFATGYFASADKFFSKIKKDVLSNVLYINGRQRLSSNGLALFDKSVSDYHRISYVTSSPMNKA